MNWIRLIIAVILFLLIETAALFLVDIDITHSNYDLLVTGGLLLGAFGYFVLGLSASAWSVIVFPIPIYLASIIENVPDGYTEMTWAAAWFFYSFVFIFIWGIGLIISKLIKARQTN